MAFFKTGRDAVRTILGVFVAFAVLCGAASAFVGPRRALLGSSGPQITLSAATIAAGAANGTTLGTASLSGIFTGTPSWSLTDTSGTFQINSSTGAVTVLSNTQLTGGNTIPITISATGTTPLPTATIFNINVLAPPCTNQFVMDYSNSCALIAQGWGE